MYTCPTHIIVKLLDAYAVSLCFVVFSLYKQLLCGSTWCIYPWLSGLLYWQSLSVKKLKKWVLSQYKDTVLPDQHMYFHYKIKTISPPSRMFIMKIHHLESLSLHWNGALTDAKPRQTQQSTNRAHTSCACTLIVMWSFHYQMFLHNRTKTFYLLLGRFMLKQH